MFDFLNYARAIYENYGFAIMLYLPLGAVGIWRWTVFALKKVVGRQYKPTPPNNFTAQVSLVVPVYNESPQVFTEALKSWIANKPHEIIAVIDQHDQRSADIFLNFQKKYPKLCRSVITPKAGKREALVDGINAARGEIIALVDSDTLWDLDLKKNILYPFADPLVGGVAPRQFVLSAETWIQQVYSIQLDSRYDEELPFLAASGNALTCISGRTAFYRKEAIIHLREALLNEEFAGEKCISGDDKCLTRLVQKNRWKIKYQANAVVYTDAARDLKTYLKQRVRWTRNSWRSDLKSIFDRSRWILREKTLLFHMVDRFLQPFALLLGPIYFAVSVYFGFYVSAIILLLWWFASRTIKMHAHLRRHPEHLDVMWPYVFVTYLVALIKVYAWFSITRQGWKTRWDEERLTFGQTAYSVYLLRLFSSALTILVVLTLVGSVIEYRNFTISLFINKNRFAYAEADPTAHEALRAETIAKVFDERAVVTYKVKPGETFASIGRKFNMPTALLAEYNPSFNALDPDITDQIINLPVAGLRHTRNANEIKSMAEPIITYIPVPEGQTMLDAVDSGNIIRVAGPGAVVRLSDIYEELQRQYPDNELLVKLNGKEWLLNASLEIDANVILVLHGNEVEWLKLKSDRDGFVWLASFDGGMHIENTKITSWDTYKNTYDTELEDDGRSFILTKDSGRTDIVNSELAYLGYSRFRDNPRGYPFGGIYGVSWRIPTGSYGTVVVAGNILNSFLHHNQFGFYTYGAIGMIIDGNVAQNNIQYGFDPHDDSNYLLITNNQALNNGNHGIITSKRCFYNVIANNQSYGNKKHGIMLDQDSNYNLVEKNSVAGNLDGIVLLDSHHNVVRDNDISGNEKSGIRMNIFSSSNYISANSVSRNTYGLYFYDKARANIVRGNSISLNRGGIFLKNTNENIILENAFSRNNQKLRLGDRALYNAVEI